MSTVVSDRLVGRLGEEITTAILLLLSERREGLTWAQLVVELIETPGSAFYGALEAVGDALLTDGVLVAVDPETRMWRLTESGVEAAMMLTPSGELPDVEPAELRA